MLEGNTVLKSTKKVFGDSVEADFLLKFYIVATEMIDILSYCC